MEDLFGINAHRQAVQENIEKSFQYISEDDLEKARTGTYKDNAENRGLMRVGQNYGEANGGNQKGDVVEAVVNGKTIRGKYEKPGVDFYGNPSHVIHLSGNSYFNIDVKNATFKNITRSNREALKKEKSIKAENNRKEAARVAKINNRNQALYDLGKKEARIRLEMEEDPEVIANVENGNHPAVAKYAKLLDTIENKKHKIYLELRELDKQK